MEVKGIGEKLFLTLKPYLSVSGTRPRSTPRFVSRRLLRGPRFLPGAGREGETRQRRPRGQGTVTSRPPGALRAPGPSRPSSGMALPS